MINKVTDINKFKKSLENCVHGGYLRDLEKYMVNLETNPELQIRELDNFIDYLESLAATFYYDRETDWGPDAGHIYEIIQKENNRRRIIFNEKRELQILEIVNKNSDSNDKKELENFKETFSYFISQDPERRGRESDIKKLVKVFEINPLLQDYKTTKFLKKNLYHRDCYYDLYMEDYNCDAEVYNLITNELHRRMASNPEKLLKQLKTKDFQELKEKFSESVLKTQYSYFINAYPLFKFNKELQDFETTKMIHSLSDQASLIYRRNKESKRRRYIWKYIQQEYLRRR